MPIRHKTLITYRSVYRCHLDAAIGDKKLSEVRRTDVQAIIVKLSPQISQTTLAVLKTIYREALAQDLVENSPAHGVRGHRVIVKPRTFLTWEELDKLIFASTRYRSVF